MVRFGVRLWWAKRRRLVERMRQREIIKRVSEAEAIPSSGNL
jgi:hypothetical protein